MKFGRIILSLASMVFVGTPAFLRADAPATRPVSSTEIELHLPVLGVQLTYPANWSTMDDPPIDEILLTVWPGPKPRNTIFQFHEHGSLLCISIPANQKVELKAMFDELMGEISRAEGEYVLIESKPFDWKGVPAYQATYIKQRGGAMTKSVMTFALRNQKQFIFNYNANVPKFDEHLPAMTKVLNSVVWSEPKAPEAPKQVVQVPSRPRPQPPTTRPRVAATQPAPTAVAKPPEPVATQPAPPPASVFKPKPITKARTKVETGNFAFDLPSNWTGGEVDKRDANTLSIHQYTLTSPLGANIGAVMFTVHKGGPDIKKTLEALKKGYIDNAKNELPDFAATPDPKSVSIDGTTSQVFRVTFSRNGSFKGVYLLLARKNKAYAFKLTTTPELFDKVEPQFLEMMKSIRWQD